VEVIVVDCVATGKMLAQPWLLPVPLALLGFGVDFAPLMRAASDLD
jgi:hypothetical protein